MPRTAAIPEARQEERFPTNLRVKLENGVGIVRDVSTNGIYFVTDVAVKQGQPLKFTLEFPDFPSGPIVVHCAAQVVRLEEQGTSTGVGASISSFEFRRVDGAGKSSA